MSKDKEVFSLNVKDEQFIFHSGKLLDKTAVPVFRKIVIPLRKKTGLTAQAISKIFLWVFWLSLILWAIADPAGVLGNFLIMGFALFSIWTNHKKYIQFLPLSEKPLHEVPIAVITDAVEYIKGRRFSNGYFLVLLVSWCITVPKEVPFIIPVMIAQNIEYVAMTCGGEVKRPAKEKKISYFMLLKLKLIPNGASNA